MDILFTITGKVQEGKKRGKILGYPTMNIPLTKKIPEGVYISQTVHAGVTYNSLTFIGKAETFGEITVSAESYVLGFDKNIYGDIITIYLIKKIRNNQKFSSAEDLVQQMKKDKLSALEYFKKK